MSQLQNTKDYEQFKFLSGNRPIDRYHLKKLKGSIEKSNRLDLHPIIINQNNEIIDGQHRYIVAKELGLQLFYIKSDTIEDLHLIECNFNQKAFEVENFIHFFAIKEKTAEYIELYNILKETRLKPKAVLNLIIGVVSPQILDFLKIGKFKFPGNQPYREIINFYLDFSSYVKERKIKPLGMFTNHNFAKALRILFLTTGFEKEVFFRKLDLKWFELKPQSSAQDWYFLLLSIYNHKNHNKIENERTDS
jgi:hypothetical protein